MRSNSSALVLKHLLFQAASFTGGETEALSWCQHYKPSLPTSGLYEFPYRFAYKQQSLKRETETCFRSIHQRAKKDQSSLVLWGERLMRRGQEAPVTKVWYETGGKTWPHVPMRLSLKWG